MSKNPELAKLATEDAVGKDGLKPFAFKDTGEHVHIRHVSPLLIGKINNRYPPPKPPSQKVNYGTDEEPNWVEEENTAHPDYLLAMHAYNEEMEERAQKLLIDLGVQVQMTDERKEAVKAMREYMKDDHGVDLAENDKMIFVKYIAIGTPEDMNDLMTAITRRSRPTEEAVAEATNGFQG